VEAEERAEKERLMPKARRARIGRRALAVAGLLATLGLAWVVATGAPGVTLPLGKNCYIALLPIREWGFGRTETIYIEHNRYGGHWRQPALTERWYGCFATATIHQ
jgi:hypothetical protein